MSTKQMTEKHLQSRFVEWLKRYEILYYKTHGGMMYQKMFSSDTYLPFKMQKGYPDLMIFLAGKTIFIELKSDIGSLSDDQKERFPKLMENGFQVYVLRPRHWEMFKQAYWKRGMSFCQSEILDKVVINEKGKCIIEKNK